MTKPFRDERGHFLKGYHHTSEAIEKIRKAKLGDKNPMKRSEVAFKQGLAMIGKHSSPGTEFKKGENLFGFKRGHPLFSGAEKGWIRKNDGPWVCKCCGEIFEERFSLGGHSNLHGNFRRIPHVPNPYGGKFTEELKEKIRERDNYICQICGRLQEEEIRERGCRLSVHHVDGRKKNNTPENLFSLCVPCHSSVAKKKFERRN